ncbi:MAG: tyrosine-type recombinase/integrase [Desulfobacterales bacterium]|nr:tyrosine-type recombinase/integrase [Desulfobacterales bacterium]
MTKVLVRKVFVPMGLELGRALADGIVKALKDHQVLSIIYKGKPIRSVLRSFKQACKKAGIPYGLKGGIVFHDLRHTCASHLVTNFYSNGILSRLSY